MPEPRAKRSLLRKAAWNETKPQERLCVLHAIDRSMPESLALVAAADSISYMQLFCTVCGSWQVAN